VPRTDDGGGSPATTSLEGFLAEARQLGFLGPGPLDQQLRHARGFVAVARPLFSTAPRRVDMGAGGGLPGLVLAHEWPEAMLVLLEANERRSAFLKRAVDGLELSGRVSVLQQRAEIAGRDPQWRASFDGAVARSFGRPAVLAECTAPLLKVGAWVVVSEPPAPTVVETVPTDDPLGVRETVPAGGPQEWGGSERWPVAGLGQVGLEPSELIHAEFDYQLLRQVDTCPERFPRRNGVPAKRPLF
jgi:16S rRNA (guanine527-N7)-methyltransferase